MKRIKLFSALFIFTISFFLTGIYNNINAQGVTCKFTFCSCCGETINYIVHYVNGDSVAGTFSTNNQGCTGANVFSALPGVSYYVDIDEGCPGPRVYFTGCFCPATDTVLLILPCCDGGDANNKNKNIQPKEFKLDQNFPNPFNPSTMISFELPEAVSVTLTIYDVTGKVIERPFVNNTLKSGYHEFIWNTDSKGLSSGIYFYKLEAGNFSETKKMILMK